MEETPQRSNNDQADGTNDDAAKKKMESNEDSWAEITDDDELDEYLDDIEDDDIPESD